MTVHEAYYTPGRIARRIADLPYLLVLPIGDVVNTESKRQPRVDSGTAIDERVCEKADLERALWSLSPLEFVAVVGFYLLDIPLDVLCDDLCLTQTQAARIVWESVKAMARALGWWDRLARQLPMEDGPDIAP